MSITLPPNLQNIINPVFRAQSWQQLATLQPREVIPFHDSPLPENYTIVLRPPTEVIHTITALQSELQNLNPDHYYYPAEQLHLTILGKMETTIAATQIITALQGMIKLPYRFVLYGLGSNQLGVSLSAYPDFNMAQLRQQLRQTIGTQGDDYSFHLPAYEQVGWINCLRYTHEPSLELLAYLRDQRDRFFGVADFPVVQLYKNRSKVLSPHLTELIWEQPHS
jgi:hypothetical protein